ncbi:artemin [Corythoichthys intestinalis]|uniref:artemin n=1 Tax=Corythoichthys intestinalis TaxID=161448 RepID=UPI0025A684E6|nr:artemin [Corythoichthys intestinalis]
MLWLMTALLALSEDVLSEEGGPQNRLEPPRRVVGRTPRRTPARETRDHADTLWLDDSEAWVHTDGASKRWRRSLAPTSKRGDGGAGCRLEKRQLRVRDLGLGYDSDETVVFKFCAGSCRAARRNYDLALGALVARGDVSPRRVSRRPCCRPTRYDAVSFMDMHATWRTVRWLSAGDCGCVG